MCHTLAAVRACDNVLFGRTIYRSSYNQQVSTSKRNEKYLSTNLENQIFTTQCSEIGFKSNPNYDLFPSISASPAPVNSSECISGGHTITSNSYVITSLAIIFLICHSFKHIRATICWTSVHVSL